MGYDHLTSDWHVKNTQRARSLFFSNGGNPEGLVPKEIVRSWERCRRFGLSEDDALLDHDPMDRQALKIEQERSRRLLSHGRPIMEHVYDHIRESGSMVVLADANGLILETVGDPDFLGRADRVALSAGASWDENLRGTNAIGTALIEGAATQILGAQHFLNCNSFLSCCSSPIFGPDGEVMGILDISGDYRAFQPHTLGLVRMSSRSIEKRMLETLYARDILVCFHENPDYLGSPQEGVAAVSAHGQVLAVNRNGLALLGIRRFDAVRRDFSLVFGSSFSALIDEARRHPFSFQEIRANGRVFRVHLRGHLPSPSVQAPLSVEAPEAARPRPLRSQPVLPVPELSLATLNTGDPRLQRAIDRAGRVIGRDIPILIQGESGSGKEMFAKAFHNSGMRRTGPFVALNCAAIPETLIESELFGYMGGAFTGARKEGAPGKIQQAHGGTLFLDEIGDMPLNLQARLLRVLQERSVTPLGSTKSIQVDISLICATHHRLREEVASGSFREDLYYRLNGLSLNLPALREREDLRVLAIKLAADEALRVGRAKPVGFSEGVMQRLESYSWPGNIRQLNNVIRVAIALLDEEASVIDESHLPEELFETGGVIGPGNAPARSAATPQLADISLEAMSRQAALNALESAGGNISAAARLLGVSRNTLYRKLGRF